MIVEYAIVAVFTAIEVDFINIVYLAQNITRMIS